jgi:hypothetical protein
MLVPPMIGSTALPINSSSSTGARYFVSVKRNACLELDHHFLPAKGRSTEAFGVVSDSLFASHFLDSEAGRCERYMKADKDED